MRAWAASEVDARFGAVAQRLTLVRRGRGGGLKGVVRWVAKSAGFLVCYRPATFHRSAKNWLGFASFRSLSASWTRSD